MASNADLIVQNMQGVTCVTFHDKAILDGAVIDRIGKQLFDLIDKQDRRKMVLDMSHVEFLSSAMIGVIISLQRKHAERKGKLVMCGLRDNLMKVFKLTRLDKLLTFKKDEQAALAAARRRDPSERRSGYVC